MSVTLKKAFGLPLILLYLLTVLDYVLTYIGVHQLGVISEGNPLLTGLIALPFWGGILCRCFISAVPVFLLFIAKYRYSYKHYHQVIVLLLAVQVIPYSLHLFWIIRTLTT